MTEDIHQLHLDSILYGLKASNAKEVLKKLSVHTSRLIGSDKNVLLAKLLQQEHQEGCGIGDGVAIAHMRLPRLTKPFIIFTKLDYPVEFKSVDNQPIDLVCLVLSPEFEGPKYLSRLSAVSRFFSNKNFCNQLRNSTDDNDIRLIVSGMNSRKMAA